MKTNFLPDKVWLSFICFPESKCKFWCMHHQNAQCCTFVSLSQRVLELGSLFWLCHTFQCCKLFECMLCKIFTICCQEAITLTQFAGWMQSMDELIHLQLSIIHRIDFYTIGSFLLPVVMDHVLFEFTPLDRHPFARLLHWPPPLIGFQNHERVVHEQCRQLPFIHGMPVNANISYLLVIIDQFSQLVFQLCGCVEMDGFGEFVRFRCEIYLHGSRRR